MTNPYYNPSGVPATRAQLSSSAMRTELVAIKAGFDKLAPTLTGNALLHVNAAGTQQVAHASLTVSAAGAVAGITDLTATGNTVLGNASTDTLNVGAGGIVKDASGNVGIGGSPVNRLDVFHTATGIGFRVRNTSTGVELAARTDATTTGLDAGNAAGGMSFSLNTVEKMRLDTAGNLGVGTPSPQRLIHAQGSEAIVASYQAVLEGRWAGCGAGLSFQSRTSDSGARVEMARITADGEASWDTTASNQIAGLNFYTAYNGVLTKRAQIDGIGNFILLAPAAAPILNSSNQLVLNMTSDTNVRISGRGSDGVTRFIDLTLTT